MSARKFEDTAAVRESVPLLVGLMGPSSSGKTFSALRLAVGIQEAVGGEIYGIDTEGRRMLHYADTFKFRHVEFGPPFGSLDYLAVIQYCVDKGGRTIIIDSMSHEHNGVGGYLSTQEAEIERLAGNDWAKRDRVKFLAWQKPSQQRQRMIEGIKQINANFIFCFRAKEKVKPVKNEKTGKTEPVEMGFMPIAGEEWLFEQTVNCLLLPKADGVPSWRSDHIGERFMMKLPEQFKAIFAESKPLDEATGRALAQWARGGDGAKPEPHPAATPPPGQVSSLVSTAADPSAPQPLPPPLGAGAAEDADRYLAEEAEKGGTALRTAWLNLTPEQKRLCKAALDTRHKRTAEAVDAAAAGPMSDSA